MLYVMLFGGHPFVSPEDLSLGQSCVSIMMENSLAENMLLPPLAQGLPGAVGLLRKVCDTFGGGTFHNH